jgi:hypothetical protein
MQPHTTQTAHVDSEHPHGIEALKRPEWLMERKVGGCVWATLTCSVAKAAVSKRRDSPLRQIIALSICAGRLNPRTSETRTVPFPLLRWLFIEMRSS